MEIKQLFQELQAEKHWGETPNQTVFRYIDELCRFFDGRDITTIGYADMVNYVAHLRQVSPKGAEMSGATVNRYLACALVIFGQYRRHDRSFMPPPVPREDERKYKQEVLTKERVFAIADKLDAPCKTVWLVLHETGARVGEILGGRLKASHVSLDGYVELVDTKNGEDRTVDCGQELAVQLKALVQWGTLPPYSTFRHRLRKACWDLGFEPPARICHMLRHAYCIRTASTDEPLDIVMHNSGHKTLSTLMRYRKLSKDVQRKAARRLRLALINNT